MGGPSAEEPRTGSAAGRTSPRAGEPSTKSSWSGVFSRVVERCINLKFPKAGRATVVRRAVSNSTQGEVLWR
eukprot:1636326-Rhodomonas_salina.3